MTMNISWMRACYGSGDPDDRRVVSCRRHCNVEDSRKQIQLGALSVWRGALCNLYFRAQKHVGHNRRAACRMKDTLVRPG